MRLFTVEKCGDPYNKTGYDISEYENSFSDQYCTYRGDLSPSQGRDKTILILKRLYPECKVKILR